MNPNINPNETAATQMLHKLGYGLGQNYAATSAMHVHPWNPDTYNPGFDLLQNPTIIDLPDGRQIVDLRTVMARFFARVARMAGVNSSVNSKDVWTSVANTYVSNNSISGLDIDVDQAIEDYTLALDAAIKASPQVHPQPQV